MRTKSSMEWIGDAFDSTQPCFGDQAIQPQNTTEHCLEHIDLDSRLLCVMTLQIYQPLVGSSDLPQNIQEVGTNSVVHFIFQKHLWDLAEAEPFYI